jgi:hypothetical protein
LLIKNPLLVKKNIFFISLTKFFLLLGPFSGNNTSSTTVDADPFSYTVVGTSTLAVLRLHTEF